MPQSNGLGYLGCLLAPFDDSGGSIHEWYLCSDYWISFCCCMCYHYRASRNHLDQESSQETKQNPRTSDDHQQFDLMNHVVAYQSNHSNIFVTKVTLSFKKYSGTPKVHDMSRLHGIGLAMDFGNVYLQPFWSLALFL
jgi:hypothetical protein